MLPRENAFIMCEEDKGGIEEVRLRKAGWRTLALVETALSVLVITALPESSPGFNKA